MNNKELIKQFYSAFAAGDHKGMIACYHDEVVFEDPAFGQLKGIKAAKMWEMLLSRKEATPKINFANIEVNETSGSADWTAEYIYGPKKRKVFNRIHASFTFKDGKIIKHTDNFNLWKWSSQALGTMGYIMGWTPFMKNKIQQLANSRLDKFIEHQ